MGETSAAELLTPEMIAELKRIELRTRRMLSGDMMGSYRSAFRGSGLVFADLREYAPGDDVKSIHWKATARSDKVYVKCFQEDRSIEVVVAVDESLSLSAAPWGSAATARMMPPRAVRAMPPRATRTMHHTATEFAASVLRLAQQSGDAVGLALFGKEVRSFERPRSGLRATEHLLLTLLKARPEQPGTDINSLCNYLRSNQRRRSLVFIVSDFFAPDFKKSLTHLSRRHEVVLVYLDAHHHASAAAGLLRVRDPETGSDYTIDLSSARVREAFEKARADHWRALAYCARQARVDLLHVADGEVIAQLVQLMRRRQSQRGGGRCHVVGDIPRPGERSSALGESGKSPQGGSK
jgi:uncharacterized protein (DUF58 family)